MTKIQKNLESQIFRKKPLLIKIRKMYFPKRKVYLQFKKQNEMSKTQ